MFPSGCQATAQMDSDIFTSEESESTYAVALGAVAVEKRTLPDSRASTDVVARGGWSIQKWRTPSCPPITSTAPSGDQLKQLARLTVVEPAGDQVWTFQRRT